VNKRTDLASGTLNGTDRIMVELVQPPDGPPLVKATWPGKPTVSTPTTYPQVAASIVQIFAASATALARWKAHSR
jgi:hypothetical protein